MANGKQAHRWMKRLRGRDAGQALVEAALTLPLLFLLLLGAAELGWLAYNAIEVTNAAKTGVAYGAQSGVCGDATGIQNAARLDASDVTATLTATSSTAGVCSSGTACTGAGNTCSNTDCPSPDHIETILTVNTSATVNPLIHLTGLPVSYTLHGRAVQKCLP